MPLIIDQRWEGPHGIGRFAREVASRIPHQPLPLSGKPLHPLDPFKLHRALQKNPSNMFFSPGFNPPWGRPCPFFFTIHDLIHLEVPEESGVLKRLFYEALIRPALKQAEAVFTVSEFSKSRIAEWGRISSEKIIVVGNGVSPSFTPEGDSWQGTHRPYFLYVGNHKPHKNTRGLIEAFEQSEAYQSMDLLLTGFPTPELEALVASRSLAGSVKFLGLVDELSLAALYRGTRALVLPSWYEGFGLPLVEAMASGAPVLSSNRTSLPEIGGDAVRYFDPGQPETLVEGLRQFEAEEASDTLRDKGLEQAKRFNWDQVATRIRTTLEARGEGSTEAPR